MLHDPTPGLRAPKGFVRVRNRSRDVAKVSVVIASGDEMVVSEALARQLAAGDPHLEAVEPEPEPPKPKPAKAASGARKAT